MASGREKNEVMAEIERRDRALGHLKKDLQAIQARENKEEEEKNTAVGKLSEAAKSQWWKQQEAVVWHEIKDRGFTTQKDAENKWEEYRTRREERLNREWEEERLTREVKITECDKQLQETRKEKKSIEASVNRENDELQRLMQKMESMKANGQETESLTTAAALSRHERSVRRERLVAVRSEIASLQVSLAEWEEIIRALEDVSVSGEQAGRASSSSSSSGTWTCKNCTLLNPKSKDTCEVCTAPAPKLERQDSLQNAILMSDIEEKERRKQELWQKLTALEEEERTLQKLLDSEGGGGKEEDEETASGRREVVEEEWDEMLDSDEEDDDEEEDE